jgi:hypothetical protein
MSITSQQFSDRLQQYWNQAMENRNNIDKNIPTGSAYAYYDGMQDAWVHITTMFNLAHLQSLSSNSDAMKVIEFLEKEINSRIGYYEEQAKHDSYDQEYKKGGIHACMEANSFVSSLRSQL